MATYEADPKVVNGIEPKEAFQGGPPPISNHVSFAGNDGRYTSSEDSWDKSNFAVAYALMLLRVGLVGNVPSLS